MPDATGNNVPFNVSTHRERVELAARIEIWLHRNGWRWVYRDGLDKDFSGDAARTELLRHMLNPHHPLVKQIRQLNHWLPERIKFILSQKGMPCIGSKHLSSLAMGSGADDWLKAATASGLIMKKARTSSRRRQYLY